VNSSLTSVRLKKKYHLYVWKHGGGGSRVFNNLATSIQCGFQYSFFMKIYFLSCCLYCLVVAIDVHGVYSATGLILKTYIIAQKASIGISISLPVPSLTNPCKNSRGKVNVLWGGSSQCSVVSARKETNITPPSSSHIIIIIKPINHSSSLLIH